MRVGAAGGRGLRCLPRRRCQMMLLLLLLRVLLLHCRRVLLYIRDAGHSTRLAGHWPCI